MSHLKDRKRLYADITEPIDVKKVRRRERINIPFKRTLRKCLLYLLIFLAIACYVRYFK